MLEQIQLFYDQLFKELKAYISNNSKYKSYIFKKQPEEKLFPLVTIKDIQRNGKPTTLSYTDYKYTFSLEINVYSLTNNGVAGETICKEISAIIERFFNEKYRMDVEINPNAPNADGSVSRTLIRTTCTIDTKNKDKLIICI